MAVNVRLKHSSIDSKSPVAADLLEGEVALNINANSPAAYIKDSNGDIVKLAGAGSVTDATNVKKVGDTMTGPLVLSGDPTADDQASNKKYVDDVAANAVVDGDAKYVDVAGDNMTGPLVLSGDPTADNQASNKKYVDDVAAATVTTADGKYVDVAGDNMTGDLTLGTDKITLDASGESTFLGDMIVHGDAQSNVEGVKIQSGMITTCQASGQNSVFRAKTTAGGDVKIDLSAAGRASFAGDLYVGTTWGGLAPSTTPPITLTATGDGSFAGQLDVGSVLTASGGFRSNPEGTVFINPASSAPDTATVFLTYKDRSVDSSTGVSFTKEGAATFAGTVESQQSSVGVDLFKGGYGSAAGTFIVRGNGTIVGHETGGASTGNYNYKIDSNGSATFGSGGFKIDGNGYIQSNIQSAGLLQLDHTAAFISPKIELSSVTGNATFVGTVESTKDTGYAFLCNGGGLFNNASGSGSLFLKGNGATYPVGAWNDEDNHKLEIGDGVASAWQKITLDGSDGSATFDGTVTAPNVTFNLEADDDTKYDVTTEEYTETETYTVEVPVLRPEGVVGTADLVDEPKTRTITKEREVTKTREIRTYNGAVLDVKDELQSLRSRATQQDETIRLMTAALKSLGIDTASFPSPEDEEPKTKKKK